MKLFNDENRMANILHSVENQVTCNIEKLAGKLDLSTKTIRNDIKELNCLMGGYAVISNKKNEYKLIVFNQTGYEEIRDKIYQQEEYFNSPQTRMAFIFWQLMDAKRPYLIDDLAEQMKVGRTTANSDIKRIRAQAKDYRLEIKGKANTGLTLEGREIDIRFFLLENYYEQIYLKYPLGTTLRKLLYQFQKKYSLDALGFGLFFRSFVIMVDRLQNGHTIEMLEKKYIELQNNAIFQLVEEFAGNVEQATGLRIPRTERIYLCLPLVGMRTPANIEGIENFITISEDAAELIIAILDRIQDELGVTVVVNELFDDFVYHVFFMINRLKYGFKIHNELVDDFKDEYSLAYKMAEIARELIEEQTNVVVSVDEMGYLAAYFGVFLLEQVPDKKPFKVAIACGSGKIIGRLIANQLKSIFEVDPMVKYIYDRDYMTESFDGFDFVITTSKEKLKTTLPVIYIDEIFDKELLKRKVKGIKYLKEMGIPIRQGIDSVFLNLIDEERFFILDGTKPYEESMEYVADSLIQQGLVDAGFTERLIKREHEATMVFEKNIAFPHIQTLTDNLSLAFGVFPEVKEGEMKAHNVKLMIMLAIPETLEDDTILVQLYDDMLSITGQPDVVDHIKEMGSYRDLLLYFAEENDILK